MNVVRAAILFALIPFLACFARQNAFAQTNIGAGMGKRSTNPPGKGRSSDEAEKLTRHLVTHLIGMKVEDADGEKIGKINNFILDIQASQPKFVVLSSGGFSAIRAR